MCHEDYTKTFNKVAKTIMQKLQAGRACTVTPAGGGSTHTTQAIATLIPRVFMSAPHLNCFGAGASADAAETTVVLPPAAAMHNRCACFACLTESLATARRGRLAVALSLATAAVRDDFANGAALRWCSCPRTGAAAARDAIAVDITFALVMSSDLLSFVWVEPRSPFEPCSTNKAARLNCKNEGWLLLKRLRTCRNI